MSERATEREDDIDNAAVAEAAAPAPQAAPATSLVQVVARRDPSEVAAYLAANPFQTAAVMAFIQRTLGNRFASAVIAASSVTNRTTTEDGKTTTAAKGRSVALGVNGLDASATESQATTIGDSSSSSASKRSVSIHDGKTDIADHRETAVVNGEDSRTASADRSVAIDGTNFEVANAAATKTTLGDSSSAAAARTTVGYKDGEAKAANHQEMTVADGKDGSASSIDRSVAYKDGTVSAQRATATSENQGESSRAEKTSDSVTASTDGVALKTARELEVHGDKDAYSKQSSSGSFAAKTDGSVAYSGAAAGELHEGDRTEKSARERAASIDTDKGSIAASRSDVASIQDGDSSSETKSARAVKLGLTDGSYANSQSLVVKDGKDAESSQSSDTNAAYGPNGASYSQVTKTAENQGDKATSASHAQAAAIDIAKRQVSGSESTETFKQDGKSSVSEKDAKSIVVGTGGGTYAKTHELAVKNGDDESKQSTKTSAELDIEKRRFAASTAAETSEKQGKSSVATKATKDFALAPGDAHYATTRSLDVDNDGDRSHQSDATSLAYKDGTVSAQRTSEASENQGDSSRSSKQSDSLTATKDGVAVKTARELEVHGDKDAYSKQSSNGSFAAKTDGSVAVSGATANEIHEGDRTEKSARERAASIDMDKGSIGASRSDLESVQDGDSSMEKKSARAVKLGLTDGSYANSQSLVVKNGKDAESSQSSDTNAAYGPNGASYSQVTKSAEKAGDKATSASHSQAAAIDIAKRQVSGSESTETFKQDGKSSVSEKDAKSIVVGANGGSYAKSHELAVKNGDDESKQSSKTSAELDIEKRKFAASTATDTYEKQGDSSVAKSDARNIGYADGTASYGSANSLEVTEKDAHHKATAEKQISASLEGGKYHTKTTDEITEKDKTKKEAHERDVALSLKDGLHASKVDETSTAFGKNSIAHKDAKSIDINAHGAAIANSTETTAANASGSRTTGADRKLAINDVDGATYERGSHEKTTIGDKTDEASRKGTFNIGGKNGAEVGLSDSQATTVKTGDTLTTDERKRHLNANLHGGDAGYEKTHTEKTGEASSATSSTAVNAGFHDGVGALDAKHSVGSKDADGSHDASVGGSIKTDGSASASFAVKDVHKDGDTTHTSTGTGGMGVDKDGHVNANMGRVKTDETKDGGKATTATNAGMSSDGTVNFAHTNATENKAGDTAATSVAAHAGPNGAGFEANKTKKNADGSSSGVNGGLDVDFKSGNVSAHAGYSLITKGGTSVTATVSHGTTVHAEIVKTGEPGHEEYDVQYVVTTNTSVGGGASKGPVGGSVGANESDFESGSKHFTSLAAATKFRDNAAAVVHAERPATSIDGALAIPIGESRGAGHTDGINASGKFSMEGASLTASGHASSTHELDIKRVSQHWVTVTDTMAGDKGHDFGISGLGLSNTKGETNTKYESRTFWFDLSTTEGKAAFQRYCANRVPPKLGAGVKLGPESGGKAHEEHDNMHIAGGGDSSYHRGTSENHLTDDTGSHKEFAGNQGHDLSPGWIDRNLFGGKEQHSSAELQSRNDNGTERYTAVVHVSGKDAGYNRDKMETLFNDGDDKAARDKAHVASGDWTLTADISAKTIHEVEDNAFAGQTGSSDAKMRAMSKLESERGLAMAGGLVNVDGGKTAWDVELKGDKNFPGHAGRAALDAERDKDRKALWAHPEQAGEIAASTQKTLDGLKARQKAVSDRAKYTDLPEPLRREQLAIIAQHITDFELLHNGAMAKLTAGTDTPEAMATRLASKHGYDRMPAADREFAREHDQIAVTESAAGDLAVRLRDAMPAIGDGKRGLDPVFFQSEIVDYNAEIAPVARLEEEQQQVQAQINELRPRYIDAATQRATAPQMQQLVTRRLALLKEIQQHVMAAAKLIRPGILDERMGSHAVAWWNQYDKDTMAPMPKATKPHH